MTKRVLAVLSLLFVLTIAMGGSVTAPTAAAPMTPSLSAPEMCEPVAPDTQWGGCRWYCGTKSYLTRAQCQANCSSVCEPIC
jgi:hypothetical protein